MHILKVLSKFTVAVFSPITLFAILASIAVVTLPLYRQTFATISEPHRIVSNPDTIASEVISYVLYGRPIQLESFTNREQIHLSDIRTLAIIAEFILLVILSILIFALIHLIKTNGNSLHRLLAWSFAVFTIFGLVTAILIRINFEMVFEFFHRSAFRNDYWQLDPMTEALIVVFPPQLFYSLSFMVASAFVISSTLLSVFFYWRHKRR